MQSVAFLYLNEEQMRVSMLSLIDPEEWLALSDNGDSFSPPPHVRRTRRSRGVRRAARGRYDAGTRLEAQFEPGSRRTVLRNLIGIKSARAMDNAETRHLAHAARMSLESCGQDQRFTAEDIRSFHQCWLGRVYPWAGEYRQVNISKGGFPFAPAGLIPDLMDDFEAAPLARNTPASDFDPERLVFALAETHVELLLIHPFRDGNGRVARHLANLMVRQAGMDPLDFSSLLGEEKKRYFQAIQIGAGRNYAPMKDLFSELIEPAVRSRS
jgi:cell filamentation protein